MKPSLCDSIEEVFNSTDAQIAFAQMMNINGVKLDLDKTDGVYKTYNNSKFIGIGVVENKLLKRDIVI